MIIDLSDSAEIFRIDEKGAGGAYHEYRIGVSGLEHVNKYTDRPDQVASRVAAKISFQNGPIKENGVNGCANEDLLLIVADRLECFQKGDYACGENATALNAVYVALEAMNERTASREECGVEGTSDK